MFLFVLVGYFMVLIIYMVFWEMWKTRNETESVVDITKAYLSQLKIVHILRDLIVQFMQLKILNTGFQ